MEIYVRAFDDDFGGYAWYTKDTYCEYMTDGKNLEADDGEYYRGSPCKTVAEAKRAASRAKILMHVDGYANPKIEFFRFVSGNLVLTKFTRDGKIKRN